MHHDIELAYLEVEVPNASAVNSFFADVVGLQPGDPIEGTSTWRNDDKAYRILVREGPRNDATVVGFEAVDSAAFDRVSRRLAGIGATLTTASDAEAAAKRVRSMVHTKAPWGPRVELVQDLERAREPFAAPLMPSGFLTEGVGFGHLVFATTTFDDSQRFVVDGLGFTQSDWIENEIMEGVTLEVRFYHCNARHHTLALAKAPFELPQKLHHLMLETKQRDDVGAAFDRAWASSLPIPNGLGCHDNDRTFSFYVTTPAGFHVEIGHGARVVDENWDDNRRYDRISIWGHQALRP